MSLTEKPGLVDPQYEEGGCQGVCLGRRTRHNRSAGNAFGWTPAARVQQMPQLAIVVLEILVCGSRSAQRLVAQVNYCQAARIVPRMANAHRPAARVTGLAADGKYAAA